MDEVSVRVEAPAERIWPLISDVTNMGRWSPECTGGAWTKGATGPAVGATFKGTNKAGFMRWTTHCTVLAADAPTHFAFQVNESGMRWGYKLEPTDDGATVVTEYRDQTKETPFPVKLIQRSGLLGRNREQLMVDGMRTTLERIKAAAEKG